VIGEEHYQVATDVQQVLQRYKSLQDIIAILGMDELSEDDKLRLRTQSTALSALSPASSTIFQKLPSTWLAVSGK